MGRGRWLGQTGYGGRGGSKKSKNYWMSFMDGPWWSSEKERWFAR